MTDFINAYSNPEKYAIEIPIDKIVSDEKIDEEYVKIISTSGTVSDMRPIVVIKHPNKDLYAVLDGHHRLAVHRQVGSCVVRAAVIDDFTGLGFEFTRRGVFQPTPLFTHYVRIPLKQLSKFLKCFILDPDRYEEK
jgi:hypothetical protein